MDLEAPLDGWYVFVAVSMITLSITGVVLAMPTAPPPDATRAANAIDGVAGTTYEAHDTIRHDAEEVKMYGRHVSFRNEHGTTHQEIAFGHVVLVNHHAKLENVAWSGNLTSHYPAFGNAIGSGNGTEALIDDVEAHRAELHGNWTSTYGDLTVRTISWTGDDVESDFRFCPTSGCASRTGLTGVSEEVRRRELAGDHDWLRYDNEHERFYATLVVA